MIDIDILFELFEYNDYELLSLIDVILHFYNLKTNSNLIIVEEEDV